MRFWRRTAAAVTVTAVACGAVATGAVADGAAPAAADGTAAGPVSVPVPQPRGSVDGELAGVSCPSDTWCVAVGSYQLGHRVGARERGGVIETWNGKRWRIASVGSSLRPIARRPLFLDSVSCASARACMAVGGRPDYRSNPPSPGTPVSERFDGTRWRPVSIAEPKGSLLDLGRVACTSPSDCTAVGTIAKAKTTYSVIEHYNGRAWSVAYRTSVRAAYSSLLDVACPARSRCVAVGSVAYGPRRRAGLVLAQRGGRWRTVHLSAGRWPVLSGVGCAAADDCLIVGTNVDRSLTAVAERYDGSRLHRVAVPGPSARPDELAGVTCATTTACLVPGAVGATNRRRGRPVTELWNGATLSPLFSGVYGAASCRPTFCMFVGTRAHRLTGHRWNVPGAS